MSPNSALHASWTFSSLRLKNPYGAYTNHSRVANATCLGHQTHGKPHQNRPAARYKLVGGSQMGAYLLGHRGRCGQNSLMEAFTEAGKSTGVKVSKGVHSRREHMHRHHQ
jgi:hypothetical protein